MKMIHYNKIIFDIKILVLKVHRMLLEKNFLYTKIYIKKQNKVRTIYNPTDSYKALLKSFIPLLEEVQAMYFLDNYDHAFVKNRNCVTNASMHINNQYVLGFDIQNFFESIPFKLINYIDKQLLSLMLVDGKVVQGFPTSPYLANIAMGNIDSKIAKALYGIDKKIVYSRYADDLTISFKKLSQKENIQEQILEILKEAGFKINNNKTKLQDKSNGRAIITGVGVSFTGVHPTRKSLKKLRAANHQKKHYSALGLNEWVKCKMPKNPNMPSKFQPEKMRPILSF